MKDMNITTPQECLESWESDYLKAMNDSVIPEEDRTRLQYDVDQLYNEMYDLLIFAGHSRFELDNQLNEFIS